MAANPCLTEIKGQTIDTAGLRALGRANGSVLTVVEFNDCKADDAGIEGLCKGCPHLKKLNLSKDVGDDFDLIEPASFTDEAVRSIAKYCPEVEVLSLEAWSYITDLSMEHLRQLAELKELNLTHCTGLSSAGVQSLLRANQSFKSIMLADKTPCCGPNFVDTALLTCIGSQCPNLTKLHVAAPANSTITNAALRAVIGGCPLLEDLRFQGVGACSNIFDLSALVSCCPRLERLYLASVRFTGDDLIRLCQARPGLLSLELFVNHITDAGIRAIAAYCHKLQKFGLGSSSVSQDAICTLFTRCVDLRTIRCNDNELMTDRSVTTLLQCCTNLKSLVLSNSRLTDVSMMAIAMYGKCLEDLQLYDLDQVTDESLILISRHCKRLKTICLSECELITARCGRALIANGKQLEQLRFNECPKIDDDECTFWSEVDELRCKGMGYRGLRILGCYMSDINGGWSDDEGDE